MNRAGNPQDRCSGDSIERIEAAVSPDYDKFLVASVEFDGTGHFAIYDLDTINNALDNAGTGYVNIGNIQCEESFTISDLMDDVDNSIQGYDLDETGNIYISSQQAPELKEGSWTTHHKQIIKIPTYARTDPSQWDYINLSAWGGLDVSGEHTEVEGIQVLNEDHVFLTVAYHVNKNGASFTEYNKMYELYW